jgi:glycosyltransferase involved in cell wall biosynthesis
MLITVITVCLNAEDTIEKTINSVIKQTYKDIEYIIWDGGSTDSTQKIIDQFSKKFKEIKVYKALDKGPGDAFNKSVDKSSGHIVGFLGADDVFYNNKVLKNISVKFKEKKSLDAVYGNLIFKNRKNQTSRQWIAGKYDRKLLLNGWSIPFPSFYFKRKCFSQYGGMDLNFNIADDFDLIFRYLYVNKINVCYLNETFVYFFDSGRSSEFTNRLKAINEIKLSFKKYNIKVNLLKYFFRRYIYKLNQFL